MKNLFTLSLIAACGPNIYPANVVSNIMADCASAGASEAKCTCATSEIQKALSLEDWFKMDFQARTRQPLDAKYQSVLASAKAFCTTK